MGSVPPIKTIWFDLSMYLRTDSLRNFPGVAPSSEVYYLSGFRIDGMTVSDTRHPFDYVNLLKYMCNSPHYNPTLFHPNMSTVLHANYPLY